ncbi:MAG: UV DNA damage repair endonuclease UvsE [Planctomycetes bacterium]|nr:UV DNA damage repair endonuclease UvsE [Planctomycetota bacterium]
MKIGYPCLNLTIGCKADRTFRLKSFSEERLIETVSGNLDCLGEILRWNVARQILFFRIISDLVPFASHPVCQFDWQTHFHASFARLGEFIRAHRLRISMHPDPFTLINSREEAIFERSRRELLYHAQVLDAMGLDRTARIQIHVGGVYGDRAGSIRRFIERFARLDHAVRDRLVVENDEKSYSLRDCLTIHEETGLPVLLDTFHHSLLNHGEDLPACFERTGPTWRPECGLPMVDYSTQAAGKPRGVHTAGIELKDFRSLLTQSRPHDFDIMLEIKDKETSALKAVAAARKDTRFTVFDNSTGAPASSPI